MTPTQIETAARNKYAAISDSFFGQDEILGLLQQACFEFTRECTPIERVYSSSTVISQQQYDFPELAISIKRITYAGEKLTKIDFDQDDARF